MPTKARIGRSRWTPGWFVPISTPPVLATSRPGMSARRSSQPPSWTQGAGPNHKKPAGKPDRESLGRSRGGLTSKIHVVADTRCRPVSRVTSAGHRHDSLAFEPVMAGIRIRRRGRGRPRTRPAQLLGDKAYSNRAIRSHLRRRRIIATIPEPADKQHNRLRRGRHGGRPPEFDAEAYQLRNVVERCINKLKGYRAVATRYPTHRGGTLTTLASDHRATSTTRPRPAPHRRGLLTSPISAPSMAPSSARSAAGNACSRCCGGMN